MACQWSSQLSGDGANASTMILQFILEIYRVLVCARIDAHKHATILNPGFVFFSVLLRNTMTASGQRLIERARRALYQSLKLELVPR